ncbi:hypothetical protein [Sphingopyxis sp.]|uniref:hypothetical protein n=1 Tax=Sphingopyxis sp. TaxID=1908224 RepID=UPI002FC796A2
MSSAETTEIGEFAVRSGLAIREPVTTIVSATASSSGRAISCANAAYPVMPSMNAALPSAVRASKF